MYRFTLLFSFFLSVISYSLCAQTGSVSGLLKPAIISPKISVAAKPRAIPAIHAPVKNYDIWKIGRFISPATMGGDDEMFDAVAVECWSVSYGAYCLVYNEGGIDMTLHLENKKKYMVTIHYVTGSSLKLEARLQYDCEGPNCSNSIQETMDFFPDPGNKAFSFIVEPALESNPGVHPPAGTPARTLIQLSITDIMAHEAKKKGRDYYLNYEGMDVKEVD